LLVGSRLLFEPGFEFLGHDDAAEGIEAFRSPMLLEEPMKSFRFGQIEFKGGECQPALSSSEFPSGISIEDDPVLRDQERLPEYEIPHFDERRQLGDWNRDLVTDIAWMRTEFVQAAGDEPAPDVAR
jgi:hypothetical protein